MEPPAFRLSQIMEAMEDHNARRLSFELLPPLPSRKKGAKEREKSDSTDFLKTNIRFSLKPNKLLMIFSSSCCSYARKNFSALT